MTLRITIICPEAMIGDANQFALCIGNSPADAETFQRAGWEDAEGKRFALASLLSGDDFPQAAAGVLRAPAHAKTVDLVAAARAQEALETWSPQMSAAPSIPAEGKLLAIIGVEPRVAITMLGVTPIPVEQ